MPEIGSSGLMSGDGKRGDGQGPQATAPILDSTKTAIQIPSLGQNKCYSVVSGAVSGDASDAGEQSGNCAHA
jgi:hypothetical protein